MGEKFIFEKELVLHMFELQTSSSQGPFHVWDRKYLVCFKELWTCQGADGGSPIRSRGLLKY